MGRMRKGVERGKGCAEPNQQITDDNLATLILTGHDDTKEDGSHLGRSRGQKR